MTAKGMTSNRFLTVHWERLGIAPADCMGAISSFMRLARDWARKQGYELAVVWVRENDEGDGSKGNHWHALYHIPDGILRPFLDKMTKRWLKQIAAGKYVQGAILTRVIGRRSSDYRNAPELYRENLTKLAVGYLLKGASREAAYALGLPSWNDGGRIVGKRWGRSQNLGLILKPDAKFESRAESSMIYHNCFLKSEQLGGSSTTERTKTDG